MMGRLGHAQVGPVQFGSVPLGWVQLVTGVGTALASVLSAHTAVNARVMRRARVDAPATTELVSVLIPARNEAARIGPTIESILATDGVVIEVIVLDDHSTDDTALVVRSVAAHDRRVRVVNGAEFPAGGRWLGKPYACQQLGDLAAGSVLAFVDADVVLHPGALRASVDLLRTYDLSLVSPYPRQQMGTAAEHVIQPLLQWLWLTFLPLRLAERPKPVSMAAANGQLLVVDANAYRAIGGHGCVAADVIEDVAMARAMKASGRRATVADGSAIATCRMYDGWGSLRDGYSKSLWAAVQPRSASRAVGGLLALTYVVPPLGAVAGLVTKDRVLARIGIVGWLAAVAGRIVSARATGGRSVDALSHPVAVVALLGLGRRSHRLRAAGSLTWKGRSVV
jgi:GT2 family glycosyltransferase